MRWPAARDTAWFGPGVPHRWLRWTRRGRRRMAQVSATFAARSARLARDGEVDPSRPVDRAQQHGSRLRAEHARFARAAQGGPLTFYVTGGHVAETGPWLYAWVHLPSATVVHAGTTTLDPRVRAWAHLTDSDPSRGHIAALVRSGAVTVTGDDGTAAALDPLDAFEVVAVRLPDDAPRPTVKGELLTALAGRGLLADGVEAAVPEHDGAGDVDRRCRQAVDDVVRAVMRSAWP